MEKQGPLFGSIYAVCFAVSAADRAKPGGNFGPFFYTEVENVRVTGGETNAEDRLLFTFLWQVDSGKEKSFWSFGHAGNELLVDNT